MGGIVAIRMAIDTINAKGVVPGATFRFISENTSPTDPATTIFAATSILSDNVTAVISNISPNMTSVVALLASKFKIPQCSFGYNSLAQKAMFPYLFRTDTSGKLLCDAVLIFVGTQKWLNIVILFNGDSESAHLATYLETKARNSTLFKNIILSQTLYNETNNSTDLGELPESLAYLTGAVMVLIGKPEQQVASLQAAKAHNLIDHNHVFIALGAYEINEIFRSLPNDSRVSVRDFDGLIMVDTPWNLTGLPAYDDFLAEYRTQPNSSFGGRVDPADLSYRQPKAYSCMMMIAYGINQALNNYPNGRSAGLDDLGNIATGVFLKTANMTQLTFNTGWTGPAGFMEVDRNGELTVGNHQFYFLQNGSAVFFAMHWGNDSNLTIITPPVYFGGSTQAPVFEPIICTNPSYTDPGGVFMVSVAGFWMACSFIVMIAVIWNRNVREIRASSPLFACVELIGLMMAYATVLIEVAKPTTAICILRPTLAIFAYVLVLGGIIAKNFSFLRLRCASISHRSLHPISLIIPRRIYRVFRNKYALQTAIRDSQLMRMVTSILFIVMVPYLVWMIADPPRPTVSFQSGFRVCASGYRIPGLETSPFLFAIFIYCLGLGVWAGYLAYKTRRVGKQWSESRTIGYVTYNLTFCAALAAPLYFVSSIESLASFYMYNSVVMFAATFTLFILFLPSMMHLVNPPKKSSSSKRMDEGRSHSRARFTELNEPSEPTVQAYEGELAVRTRRKLWPDLSPWKMKKVVLVPSKKLLILVD
ncbi:periplasmic binding protein-like I, partial [Jimgerdemannia flammicorona]